MTDDVQRFLDRFADFGAEPDPDKYENLFDPADGTVQHPGMTAPLHRDQVRARRAGPARAGLRRPGWTWDGMTGRNRGDSRGN
jgi:hypothetical protein